MKQIKLTFLLTVLMSMVGAKAFAYDIEVKNSDGVTIYYNYINDGLELEVAKSPSNYKYEYRDNVVIPNEVTYMNRTRKVTSIGKSAFSYCSGLTSVTIGNSVTSIGNHAFSNCSGLTSVTIGNSVTSIGDFAFDECSGLTSVAIPNSVTSIGIYAFEGCRGLTSVTIGNSVTSIGDYAFYKCSGMTSVTIPNSVTSIGSSAFQYCYGLTFVTIGNSVTSIGYTAFDKCSGLKKVIVKDIAAWCNIKFSEGLSNPLYYAHHIYSDENTEITDLVIPNSVTSIGNSAFEGCWGLNSVTIGNSVTSIGNSAFYNCSGLTSIEIPNSVTSIGEFAFYYCRDLTSIEIPNSVTSIGNNAFQSCIGLTSIVNSNSVTSIGEFAFSDCSSLTSIEIPNSVTSIGNNAFINCRGLTFIEIPNSVTSIGNYAFYNCSGLTSIEIPNSVTSIGNSAFQNCSGLTSVTCLAESVPTINYNVFYNSSIESATLYVPVGSKAAYEAAYVWRDFKKIIEINDYGPSCGNNVSYAFEEVTRTLTISGTGAMQNYSNSSSVPWYSYKNDIKKLVLNEGVTSIGNNAFQSCRGLTSIEIPNSVTSIGGSAFFGCKGLTSIEIPNSVTSIGNYAFQNCSGLTSIEIPNSVTSIGGYAFSGCYGLTSVTCLAESVPTTNHYAFYNSPIGSATLYVPVGSKAAYKAADIWKNFKKIIEIEVAPTPSNDALLSVQDTKGYIGKTVSVDIDLNNSTEDLTAYQFDLTLPEGLSLSQNDKGKFLVTKTSRYEDDSQTLNISKLEGNTYCFVCFSMSNEVITGTSGAILNASLTIGESVNEGSYEATISNIVVTKTDGTQLKLSDSKFNINIVVPNVIKGDANGDGEVNVSDIVEIVNYIMNKPSDKFVSAAADVNEDGEVNVTDIVKVVSIIMSANSSQAKMSAAQTEMTDNDQVQLVDNEDQTISLTLNNEGGYVASQFDLVLSDNQSLESIQLNNNRTDNHILTYTKTGENRYRVLSYSLNNATYDGHSGELLDIKVAGSGDVSVEDILFVTAEETEKRFSPLHSGTTGISVTTKQAEAMDIYSVDGRLVHKQAKSMDGLERGIYIINGKKHIVR